MPFLGIDPDGIGFLRRAVRDAIDDLDRLRLLRSAAPDEPALDTALAAVASARATLADHWLPRLDAAALALLGPAVPLPAHVLDGSAPVGFVAVEVTVDEFARRAQELAASRAWIVMELSAGPDDARVAQLRAIDGAYAALAQWLRATPGPVTADGYPAVLEQLDPYASALVLRHLGLTGEALAAASEQTMRRWHDGPGRDDPRTRWTDAALAGDNTADVLFTLLSADQEAATSFLLRCADRPELVLLSARGPAALEALLGAGLPASLAPAAAGAVIRPLSRWTFTCGLQTIPFGNPDIADPRPAVATAATPWLPWFGPRATEFGWSRADGSATLRTVLDDERGSEALAGALDEWTARLRTTTLVDVDGRLDAALLDDLAATFVLVQRALYDSVVDAATRQRALVDLAFDASQTAVSLIPTGGGVVVSLTMSVARDLARERLEHDLDRQGLLPPSVDAVTAQQRQVRDVSTADVAVAAVLAMVDQLVELGRLPAAAAGQVRADIESTRTGGADEPEASSCRTRATAEGLHAAIDRLGADATDANLLHAVVFAFVNPATEDARCQP